jgi:predicted 3-demethylubiquinone-9 3-methyltransferase (glyoxalase superfamily)
MLMDGGLRLKDRYGLSWQLVPTVLPDLFVDG